AALGHFHLVGRARRHLVGHRADHLGIVLGVALVAVGVHLLTATLIELLDIGLAAPVAEHRRDGRPQFRDAADSADDVARAATARAATATATAQMRRRHRLTDHRLSGPDLSRRAERRQGLELALLVTRLEETETGRHVADSVRVAALGVADGAAPGVGPFA